MSGPGGVDGAGLEDAGSGVEGASVAGVAASVGAFASGLADVADVAFLGRPPFFPASRLALTSASLSAG